VSTLRKERKMNELPHYKIKFDTAESSKEFQEYCFNNGFTTWFRKPIDIDNSQYFHIYPNKVLTKITPETYRTSFYEEITFQKFKEKEITK